MSTVIETMQPDKLLQTQRAELDKWFDQRFAEKMVEAETNKTPSMAIIATKGTMDWAYPPFILASTGAALGCVSRGP